MTEVAEPSTKKRKLEEDKTSSTLQPLPNTPSASSEPLRKAPVPSPTMSSTRYTSDDQITLLVGEREEKLIVSGHILSVHSDFFNAALKKEWKEGQSRLIKLPEVEYKTVLRYVDFIYGQGLHTKSIDSFDSERFKINPPCFGELADLYLFGERTLDAHVRNAIIRELIRLISLNYHEGRFYGPAEESVNKVFGETPAQSPLRRFLVDLQVKWCSDLLEDEEISLHPEYILAVAQSYCSNVRKLVPYDEWVGVAFNADDYLV